MMGRVFVVVLVGAGCNLKYKQLPPHAPPAQLAPSVEPPTASPPADSGRIYVDVDGGPAVVGRITKIEQKQELRTGMGVMSIGLTPIMIPTTVAVDVETRNVDVLCTTPCWIDLPFGSSHMLAITPPGASKTDIITLAAKREPFAYRHAMGRQDENDFAKRIGPTLLFAFGVAGLVTLPLLALGVDNNAVLFGIGVGSAAAAAGGLALLYATRPIHQDGAGVSYALPPVTASH